MSFDLSNIKEQEPKSEVLPPDMYTCAITNCVVKDTKDGKGEYIQAEFTVQAGKFAKRKFWHNFTIKNSNVKAVEIGLAQLKSMLDKAGVNPVFKDQFECCEKLLNKVLNVKTKIRTDKTYGDKVDVSYFAKVESIAPQAKTDEVPF